MLIKRLELLTDDLIGQKEFYSSVLELPVHLEDTSLHVKAGKTDIVFKQAPAQWMGQYHFCFKKE